LVLPGSHAPALTWFSGAPTDALLAVAGIMFANITDGSSQRLSFYGLQFAGQLVGIYTILILEGMRVGNQATLIYFTMAWGFSTQILSYAFTMPLFCLTHLLASRTAMRLDGMAFRIGNLVVLDTLPTVLLIGYFVPALLYAIPLPQELTALHQWFGGLWQGFPLYITLVQLIIRVWYHSISVPDTQPSAATKDFEINSLRKAYYFALSSCVVTHTPSYIIGLVNMLSPTLNKFIGLKDVSVSAVFAPQPFYLFNPVNMADGIHYLLIYDQFFGSAAALVWASAINIDISTNLGIAHILIFLCKIVGYTLLSGPAGAMLWLFWDRD
ncbi:hypothetical protein N431DRAFT_302783, partial [Stipitochalara longipes BDJ]